MADIGDLAKIAEERHLQASLRHHKPVTTTLPSLKYCLECEEEIPEGRRQAQPGCTLCVTCQQELENG